MKYSLFIKKRGHAPQSRTSEGKGLTVEWLVSDQTAVNQLTQFFAENNVNIVVKYLVE
jgi:hypothetical protein